MAGPHDSKTYDRELKMFVEPPRPVNYGKLYFLRWLAVRGKLEHSVAGQPSGPFVAAYLHEDAVPS